MKDSEEVVVHPLADWLQVVNPPTHFFKSHPHRPEPRVVRGRVCGGSPLPSGTLSGERTRG